MAYINLKNLNLSTHIIKKSENFSRNLHCYFFLFVYFFLSNSGGKKPNKTFNVFRNSNDIIDKATKKRYNIDKL